MRLYFLILDNESGEVIVDWFHLYCTSADLPLVVKSVKIIQIKANFILCFDP